jgi:hypothetical protein
MGVSFAMPVLSPSSFVQLQQVIHRYFARMMPPLVLSAVGASIAWVALSVGRTPSLASWLAAAAALAMVVAAVLTRVVNIPINAQLVTLLGAHRACRWGLYWTSHRLRCFG